MCVCEFIVYVFSAIIFLYIDIMYIAMKTVFVFCFVLRTGNFLRVYICLVAYLLANTLFFFGIFMTNFSVLFSKILLIIDLFNYYSSSILFFMCVKDNNNKQKDNIYLSFSEVLLFMAVKESNDRQLRFIGKIRFYFS